MYDPTCIQPFVEMGLEIVHRCLFRALYRRFRFARAQPVNALIADDMVEPGPDFGTVGLPVGAFLENRSNVSWAISSASAQSPSRYQANPTTGARCRSTRPPPPQAA
jgi:hypothetical protein